MSTTIAEFDRYDITEAYFLLAVRWGLYGIGNRLHHMHFKPGAHLRQREPELPNENSQAIYDELDRRLNHAIYTEGRDLPDLHIAPSLKGYDL